MKSRYVTPWLILAMVAATPIAAPIAAADPSPKDGKADAAGRAHFQRGQKLSADGNYAAAYREFEAGYAVSKRPLFLFNMAEAARASGDLAKARESYLAFIRVDPTSALAATAKARLAELDPEADTPPSEPAPAPTPPVMPLLPPSATPPIAAQSPAGQPLPPGPVARDEDRPLWKKWPFWAVVAGTVVAGGAVVYVVNRESAACGPGCSQLNFR